MNTKVQFVYGLALCVKKLWQENQDTGDFTVVVEGKRFSCFRFVLEACSGFFSGLFRSGMKETEVNSVTIVGMTSATFQLILDVVYTSADVITDENVFDVWHAANQLQVGFLVDECEKFAISMLSTEHLGDIYQNAKILNSSKVLEATLDFIINNFESCKDNETILKLDDFEVLAIMDSHELKVSTEDFVIETILKWADYFSDVEDDESVTEANISADAKTSLSSLQTSEDPTDPNLNSFPFNSDADGRDGEFIKDKEQQAMGRNVPLVSLQSSENLKNTTNPNLNTLHIDAGAKGKDVEPNNGKEHQSTLTENLGTEVLEIYDNHGYNDQGIDDEAEAIQEKNSSELRRARLQFLRKLFAASRICLASTHCLRRLQRVKLVLEDSGIRDIVVNAILYQTVGGGHGQIPSTAVHRRCSEYVNVAVYENSDGVQILSFLDNKWYTIPKSFDQTQKLHLTYFKGELFSITVNSICAISTHVLRAKGLKSTDDLRRQREKDSCQERFDVDYNNDDFGEVRTYSHRLVASPVVTNIFIVPHENYIYWLNHSDKKLYKLDLRLSANTLIEVCSVPITNVIEHIATFEDKLLVFCDETRDDSRETVTHCYDVNSRSWTRLNSLEGPAKNLSTFRHEEVTYVLQTTGDLWRMVSKGSGLIDFKLVKKLWDFHFDLHGAVTFKDELFLFGDEDLVKEKGENWPQHPELFKKIKIFCHRGNISNFEPCMIPRAALSESSPDTTWVKLDIGVPK